MDFAATFPHLVHSVALIAPAGLIRSLPDVYVNFAQAARDGKSDAELNGMLAGVLSVGASEDEEDEVVANAAALVRWQYENHQVSVRNGNCEEVKGRGLRLVLSMADLAFFALRRVISPVL